MINNTVYWTMNSSVFGKAGGIPDMTGGAHDGAYRCICISRDTHDATDGAYCVNDGYVIGLVM